ncbi:MAG: chorismate mutase [Spirochaetaceae bacterium]|nr:chorismate mutase [Spirochaetaceae bacterium]
MSKRLYGIRGAVCCANTKEDILKAVDKMCSSLFSSNKLSCDDIVSIQFTITDDLDALNPAAALRRSSCGHLVCKTALFCSAEPKIQGSLQNVIRVLITAYMDFDSNPVHVYIGGAEVLRPDFATAKPEK